MTVCAARRGTARARRRECASRVRVSVSTRFVRFVRACAAVGVLACAYGTAVAQTPPTPPGTVVRNTATVTFDRAPGVAETRLSNEVATTILPSRTRATAALLRAQVDAAGTTPVGPAQCMNAAGTAVDLPNPTLFGGTVLDATRPATVVDERVFHGGEPVFLRVADGDRNLDASVRDWVDVRLVAGTTNDAEVVRLLETGPNTGVFTGYLQTRVGAPSAGDCALQVARASTLEARYVDVADATDVSVAAATLDSRARRALDGDGFAKATHRIRRSRRSAHDLNEVAVGQCFAQRRPRAIALELQFSGDGADAHVLHAFPIAKLGRRTTTPSARLCQAQVQGVACRDSQRHELQTVPARAKSGVFHEPGDGRYTAALGETGHDET